MRRCLNFALIAILRQRLFLRVAGATLYFAVQQELWKLPGLKKS
jgi:hypothetical protein